MAHPYSGAASYIYANKVGLYDTYCDNLLTFYFTKRCLIIVLSIHHGNTMSHTADGCRRPSLPPPLDLLTPKLGLRSL